LFGNMVCEQQCIFEFQENETDAVFHSSNGKNKQNSGVQKQTKFLNLADLKSNEEICLFPPEEVIGSVKLLQCRFIANTSKFTIKQLQKIEQHAACLVFNKYCGDNEIFDLNWLPVKERNSLSLAKLAHKSLYKANNWLKYHKPSFRPSRPSRLVEVEKISIRCPI